MVTQIRHKLLNIPVMLLNFVNSRAYDTEPLHNFHKATSFNGNFCYGEVGHKNYCKKCSKDILNTEIVKGTDAEHILTNEQQDRLKEQLDNQTIEILSFEQETENTKLPITLIQKSQLILPSMSKGFKMKDVNIFLSFQEALKELNVYCKVKYTSRAKEHYGIIQIKDNNLIFFELPFYNKLNYEEISRLQEQVNFLNGEPSLKDFARDYIKSNLKEIDYQLITEKKAILIKQYLEQAITGEVMLEQEKEIENPFL